MKKPSTVTSRFAPCVVALGLALSACGTLPPRPPALPPLVSERPLAPAPAQDVLALTPAMEAFLERYVLPYDNDRLRVALLMLAVNDKGVLGFHYNLEQTLTAAEAFRRRSGNCVSFANLFVSLARAAGLDAHFQEVFIEPEWSARGNNLLVTKHINVMVKTAHHSYMIDVSGQKISPDAQRRELSDAEALALHYNNLGAEALIAGDHPAAYAWFLQAVAAEPAMPDAWSNLGVLYARNGQPEAAELVYLHTLALNEREMSAMSNLHDLYLDQGRMDEAARMQRRVERYRRENPYYLLYLSEEAVAAGQLEEAERLLQAAIRLKEKEHLLHYAMARVEFLSGQQLAAQASLERARELAPPEVRGDYQKPIWELLEPRMTRGGEPR